MSALKDFNSQFGASFIAAGTVVAGGAGDNSEVVGATIDRIDFRSGAVLIPYTTTLAATKTLTVQVTVQESDDGSTWDTAVVLQAATVVVATGAGGGSTEKGVIRIAEYLEGRKRYVRYNVKPDLNATGTDTASWGAVFVKGGAEELPAV